jgi:putative NIF3 family GTP cyclohydrolase 1 type 2
MPAARSVTLADVRAVLDTAYPPALAEDWDSGIGLTCGDPAESVGTVLLAVDVDPVTVAEAVELGADLLLTHHPLLFAVAAALPATVTGARLAGDPDREIRRVAVCGGAGGSLLPAVGDAGVDAYVTSDLSHHVAQEYVAGAGRPVLVEVAHWAGEWPWLPVAAGLLGRELGVRTVVSHRRTDPWTARADGPVASPGGRTIG